jgi:transposase
MLSLPPSVRIFICTQSTDMRRSFDTLAWMAQSVVGQDPFSGHLFVFANRRRDRVKILYWDRDGYAIWYKRLEEGTFRLPDGRGVPIEVERSDLLLLLDGVDIEGARREKRYRRKVV